MIGCRINRDKDNSRVREDSHTVKDSSSRGRIKMGLRLNSKVSYSNSNLVLIRL